MGFGIWDYGCGIRDMGLGIRDMGYGIRDMGYGIRDMGLGIRKNTNKPSFIYFCYWFHIDNTSISYYSRIYKVYISHQSKSLRFPLLFSMMLYVIKA
jgi:hypothetical protein